MQKFIDLTLMLTHCPLRSVYSIKVMLESSNENLKWNIVLENTQTKINLFLNKNNTIDCTHILGKNITDDEISDIKDTLLEHLNFRFIQYLVNSK